jgi:hypothetical protein
VLAVHPIGKDGEEQHRRNKQFEAKRHIKNVTEGQVSGESAPGSGQDGHARPHGRTDSVAVEVRARRPSESVSGNPT